MSIHYVVLCNRSFRLRTDFVYPPIPDRSSDWSCVDDERYDGPGSLIVHARTEAEAVEDFIERLEDDIESHPRKYT